MIKTIQLLCVVLEVCALIMLISQTESSDRKAIYLVLNMIGWPSCLVGLLILITERSYPIVILYSVCYISATALFIVFLF